MVRSKCAALLFLFSFLPSQALAADKAGRARLEDQKSEAQKIAEAGVVYGYPLLLMDLTRQSSTAVSKAGKGKAPVNQFVHLKAFPDAKFKDGVNPNADTLYSRAFLDLGKEPIILSVPDTKGRYYLMPLLGAWSEVFASVGKRTTGTEKGDFAITGPGWKGKLPAGVKQLSSPTEMVWILGKTEATGRKDYPAVHALQRQYTLTPLSAWGKEDAAAAGVSGAPEEELKMSPVEKIASLNGINFFHRLAALTKNNPPLKGDGEIIRKLGSIGFKPGGPFTPKGELVPLINEAAKKALGEIEAAAAKVEDSQKRAWSNSLGAGKYSGDYLKRAAFARFALGVNLSEDAVYATSQRDSVGSTFTGEKKYVLHFNKNGLPPVNAFWSLSMYNDKQLFAANPVNRYTVGSRDKLVFNEDGTLDIYIQRESPGKEKEANWLPAPAGSFNLIARMYWPKEQVVRGSYRLPAVKPVE